MGGDRCLCDSQWALIILLNSPLVQMLLDVIYVIPIPWSLEHVEGNLTRALAVSWLVVVINY